MTPAGWSSKIWASARSRPLGRDGATSAFFSAAGLFPARRACPGKLRECDRTRRCGLPPLPLPRQLRKGADARSKPVEVELRRGVPASLDLREAPLQQPHTSARVVSARGLVKGRSNLDQPLKKQAQLAFLPQPRRFPRLV